MKKTINQIKSGRFLRNVFTVASGTAGVQILSAVFVPIITRLYGPEAFGLFGTFFAKEYFQKILESKGTGRIPIWKNT